MSKRKIQTKHKNKAKRLVKKKIKHPVLKTLIIILLSFSIYYYNEIYLPTVESAVTVDVEIERVACIDGDTIIVNDKRIRLLAIDTPEIGKEIEPYGQEASDFTCDLIKSPDKIDLKQDIGNEIDKYNRDLAWVFVDGDLLQELIIQEGLGEIRYVHKGSVDYSLLTKLKKAQAKAQANKIGIWSN